MIRNFIRYGALVSAIALGACEQALEVPNLTDPDTKRVLATPADAEALLGGYYKRWHDAMNSGNPPGNFEGMANILSFQNYSSLANNCQNARAPFSGAANTNNPGNVCSSDQVRLYSLHNEVARVATNFLNTMNAATAGGKLFLGGSVGRDLRARAFAEFLRGISLGYLAMFYDSTAIPAPGMAADDPGPLRGYQEVAESSYVALQRAIDAASQPNVTGSDAFPIPQAWIPTPTALSAAEFIKLAHSFRARFRANVVRFATDPIDWNAVVADAQAGITADFYNVTSTTTGPSGGWRRIYDGGGLWHQMPPFIIGMGDVSGRYAAWLAQPVGSRGEGNQSFFMVTPDLRFPQGTDRAAQQADFAVTSCESAGATCKRYFVNRQTADQFAGLGWGWSQYDYARAHSWVTKGDGGVGLNGQLVFFTLSENRLLEAEGQLRNGNFAAARDLVNVSRVNNGGLPQILAADNTTPVPGGASCVPQAPVAPSYAPACGNLMEALKWEKRIETAYTHFAAWFLDSRRWGDLAEGVPLFWAVPFQDLLARGYATSAIYGAGPGVGMAPNSVAPKGTYGW